MARTPVPVGGHFMPELPISKAVRIATDAKLNASFMMAEAILEKMLQQGYNATEIEHARRTQEIHLDKLLNQVTHEAPPGAFEIIGLPFVPPIQFNPKKR